MSKPGPVMLDSETGEEGSRTDEGRETGATTITAERDASEVGKPGPVTPTHRIVDFGTGEGEILTSFGESLSVLARLVCL